MAKLNIIVVLCDQMRRSAMGCAGDPNVSTPHIDQLAQEGVRFSNACVTYPVCVPTRFSLMTGEYAHSRNVPAIGWRMSPAERTIADEFNDAGYATAYIGKWHLYGGNKYPHLSGFLPVPRHYQGRFQYWRGFEFRNDLFDTAYFADDDPVPRRIAGYQTDGLFDLALEYLQGRRGNEQPFFMILSVEAPHPRFAVPEAYWARWKERTLVLPPNMEQHKAYPVRGEHSQTILDDLRCYYAMIENLDDQIGRLSKQLHELALKEETAVVFMSDHGELMGGHGLTGKHYPFEESVGVPFIISHPSGGLSTGTVIDSPTCTEDLYPTLLGMAGISPSMGKLGADLTPLMKGGASRLQRPGVMLEFVQETRMAQSFHTEQWRAFRTERFKYTVKGDASGGAPWQLFDIAEDPYEQYNQIANSSYADVAREMHGYLLDRLQETADHYALRPAYGYAGWNIVG